MKIKPRDVTISNTKEAIALLQRIFEKFDETTDLIFYSRLFSDHNGAVCVRVPKEGNIVIVNNGCIMHGENNAEHIDMPVTHGIQLDCPFTLMALLDTIGPMADSIGTDYAAQNTVALIRTMTREASELVIIE